MIKQYNFKATLPAPEGDFNPKKFMHNLRWKLLIQIWNILLREKDIQILWTDKDCTAKVDFFVERKDK